MRKCQNCNHENPDNAAFCENCGIKFIDNLKKCPQCQTVNTSESRFCENCGYDFQSATPKDTGNEEQLQQSNRSNAVHDLAEQQVPTSAADVTSTMATWQMEVTMRYPAPRKDPRFNMLLMERRNLNLVQNQKVLKENFRQRPMGHR